MKRGNLAVRGDTDPFSAAPADDVRSSRRALLDDVPMQLKKVRPAALLDDVPMQIKKMRSTAQAEQGFGRRLEQSTPVKKQRAALVADLNRVFEPECNPSFTDSAACHYPTTQVCLNCRRGGEPGAPAGQLGRRCTTSCSPLDGEGVEPLGTVQLHQVHQRRGVREASSARSTCDRDQVGPYAEERRLLQGPAGGAGVPGDLGPHPRRRADGIAACVPHHDGVRLPEGLVP